MLSIALQHVRGTLYLPEWGEIVAGKAKMMGALHCAPRFITPGIVSLSSLWDDLKNTTNTIL